jgi:hypothetical protein
MSRTLRLTCARTTYFELDLEIDEGDRPEDLLAAAVQADPRQCERGAIGTSVYRIVEIGAEPADEIAVDPHAEAA